MDGCGRKKKMINFLDVCFFWWFLFTTVSGIPQQLLYNYLVPEVEYLPISDDVSSGPIRLKEPLVFFGINFDTIYVSVFFQQLILFELTGKQNSFL